MKRHNYRTTHDSYEREIFAAMEHEKAHIVVPGAETGANRLGAVFKENAAEAYSFLCQLQKYGSISGQIDVACQNQASLLVLNGNTSHYSVPLLQELKRMSEIYDIPAMNLTPAQTANMAFRLALLYTPSNPELRELEQIFRPPMLSFLSKTNWESPTFEACAEVMFADHGEISGKVFEAGKAFLAPFLDGRMDILEFGFDEDFLDRFKGEKWDDLRKEIKARSFLEEVTTPEERLAREARDMAVFGFFDKDPDTLIQYPLVYASEENMADLHRAQEDYIARKAEKPAIQAQARPSSLKF